MSYSIPRPSLKNARKTYIIEFCDQADCTRFRETFNKAIHDYNSYCLMSNFKRESFKSKAKISSLNLSEERKMKIENLLHELNDLMGIPNDSSTFDDEEGDSIPSPSGLRRVFHHEMEEMEDAALIYIHPEQFDPSNFDFQSPIRSTKSRNFPKSVV